MTATHDGDWLDDQVLEVVGADQELRHAAIEVRRTLQTATVDPGFARRLGAEVVARRQQVIEERSQRRWQPPALWPLPRPILALGGAALAVVLVLGAILVSRPAPVPVAATSAVAGLASLDPSGRVVVHFSRAMDHGAVTAALRVAPATDVRTAWSGEDLMVTPVHGLVPNSAYVLTIDAGRARTASGGRLPGDLHVVFGTAPVPQPGGTPPPAVALPLRILAAAGEDSEAVIVGQGLLLATSASKFGATGVMRLHATGAAEWLAPATDAICVSRNGRSLAYLERGGGTTSIVMAASDGTAPKTVTVPVDDGSPLGWMDDGEVSFVGGGQLQAVDRDGHVRVLASQQVDAAKDTVVISPGGRYVFLRSGPAPAAPGQGRLLDLAKGTGHELPGVVDQPAFSADGGTVAWFDGSGAVPQLALAPGAGGPVLRLPLPVAAADRVSDLGLAPAGGRFVYAVQHSNGQAELRLAAIDDGATLASAQRAGGSPNWAADGDSVAVLTHAGSQPEIAVADVPAATASGADAAAALAASFAAAQVGGDQGALRTLARSGVDVGRLPAASRASVVQVGRQSDGSYRVELRLTVDPTPRHPSARARTESLELRASGQGGPLQVSRAVAGPLADVAPGPHLARIAAGAKSGTVALTFDADLDPASVRSAFTVPATYDAATRTVTVFPAGGRTVTVGTSLRDVAGQHLASELRETVTPG